MTHAAFAFSPSLLAQAGTLIELCRRRGWHIVTAESCTGGLVAGLLTEVAGASAVIEGGFVTYSNDAKAEMLGVDPVLIARHGAVSREVASAMAEGARTRSHADLAVSITGIAGPGGGSAAKPVGLVHFGLSSEGRPIRHLERRYGDLGRSGIRQEAISDALELMRMEAER